MYEQRCLSAGFTLVELMVVVGIWLLFSTLVLVQSRSVQTSTILINNAYNITLLVRQAQSYGIGTHESEGTFSSGYGVHADTATPDALIFFADLNGNHRYDAGEEVDTLTFETGVALAGVCGTTSGGTEDCIPLINDIDITFVRPSPDAQIWNSNVTSYVSGSITITHVKGGFRTVTVYQTGQISVSNS